MTTKHFDPFWPFPQYTEEGVQLLPEDFMDQETVLEMIEDVGEALV